MKKRAVVTGLGIIGSSGIGRENFNQAVMQGVSGIKPISLFDTSSFKVNTAGEIKDFNPQGFLGVKGLRTLDRSSKLVMSASRLALDDAGISVSEDNTHSIGVVVGTTLGSVWSISEFDKEALSQGPQYVNPSLFPNTVINSPASQVSIRFNIKGLNATVSTGFTASLDAVKYAVDFLRTGRLKTVLVAGLEELCIQTFLGFYRSGCLAGLRDAGPQVCCPFDRRRNGIILGEGCVVLVLEELESALSRKADVCAEISGFGMGIDSYRLDGYNPKGEGLRKAMGMALKDSDCLSSDIGFISCGANSTLEGDLMESEAIEDIFAPDIDKLQVTAVKSMLGECFSASGAFQLAAAIAGLEEQMVPPTINYEEKDPGCRLNYTVNQAREFKGDRAMVDSFGPTGCNSALVISRFKG